MKALTNAILSVIAFFLLLRVLFLFFSLNPTTPFVAWILNISGFLMIPFAGIVPNLKVITGILDIVALITLLVYLLVGYLLVSLLESLVEPEIVEREHESIAHYHDIESEDESKHIRRHR